MPVQTTYTVVGMTCGHCVQSVTEELGKVPGVRDVSVALETGEVTVDSDGPLPIDAVAHAVDEAGYELAGASS